MSEDLDTLTRLRVLTHEMDEHGRVEDVIEDAYRRCRATHEPVTCRILLDGVSLDIVMTEGECGTCVHAQMTPVPDASR